MLTTKLARAFAECSKEVRQGGTEVEVEEEREEEEEEEEELLTSLFVCEWYRARRTGCACRATSRRWGRIRVLRSLRR